MDHIERRDTDTGITCPGCDDCESAVQIVNHLLAEQRRHDRRGMRFLALMGLVFVLLAIFVVPHLVAMMAAL